MTNDEIIQQVYAHIGGEEKSKIIKPVIIAMADLAYRDLAIKVAMEQPELAKKLQDTATGSYTGGSFTVPTDMLYYDAQKPVTNLYVDDDPAFQVADKRKFNLITSTMTNHYFAIDGRTVTVRKADGASTGNYSLEYYKIPVNSDIDDDLRNIFLELLLLRLGFVVKLRNDTQ